MRRRDGITPTHLKAHVRRLLLLPAPRPPLPSFPELASSELPGSGLARAATRPGLDGRRWDPESTSGREQGLLFSRYSGSQLMQTERAEGRNLARRFLLTLCHHLVFALHWGCHASGCSRTSHFKVRIDIQGKLPSILGESIEKSRVIWCFCKNKKKWWFP